ncbi:MAG: hypothetical protein M1819_005041 [Sarea resinae]|nr:MAG: hypothetical protein M1819_005041 [Sarea resinae]
MCSYTYSWYCCNHSTYIWDHTIEICPNHTLSAHSADSWSVDMCRNLQATCTGLSNYYCPECSEDVTLEWGLEEL